MLFLITGTPGAGKTLYTVNKLKNESRKVYYYGIKDLKLNWILLDDPYTWHDQVDDNSIIVIDEVQEIFPVRDFKKHKPSGVEALEKHRHRGLDVYFITQHSSMLDVHARRLVGTHIHLNRNFGAKFSTLYECNGSTDTKNYHELSKCKKSIFKQPKDTFNLYCSAETHTHKFSIPKSILALPFIIGLVIYFVYYAMGILNFNDDDIISGSVKSSDSSGSAKSSDSNVSILDKYNLLSSKTTRTISNKKKVKQIVLSDFVPSIKGVPASALVYKEIWKPVSFPRLSCISSKKKCICHTQQGTPYKISVRECRNYALNGFFDFTIQDKKQNKKKVVNDQNLAAGYPVKPRHLDNFNNSKQSFGILSNFPLIQHNVSD